jgi:hypothetical protein
MCPIRFTFESLAATGLEHRYRLRPHFGAAAAGIPQAVSADRDAGAELRATASIAFRNPHRISRTRVLARCLGAAERWLVKGEGRISLVECARPRALGLAP